jgi:teichuronic acid biosynthesis glycosyltransferase TuaC
MVDRFGDWLGRRGLVTWERRAGNATMLTVTNVWPHSANPAYGPFIKRSVDGLIAAGMESDVLFIRGYRGLRAYVCAALLLGMLGLRRRYALVHAHGGETALVGRLYLGGHVVASYLGSDLLAPRDGGWRTSCNRRLRSALLRRHAALLTATTTKTREMEAVLPRRARDRNRVIPDGIDLDRFKPTDREAARAYLGWSPNSRIVLFAGRAQSAIKRVWLAEEAVALARGELEDLELVIASRVDPDDMPYYYSAADCLLHTSASEGSPNVVKEALACNLPIVATPAGDIRRLVAGARPGRVVAADVPTLAREVIACCLEPVRSNGRSLTTNMSLGSAAAATLDLYGSLNGFLPSPDRQLITEAAGARPVSREAVSSE